MDALDADADGTVRAAEAQAARLRLLGYSWGAASTLELAAMLAQPTVTVPLPDGARTWKLAAPIPVDLLLVIDPVRLGRPLLPPGDHVARFANFHQTRGGDAVLRDATGNPVARVGAFLSRRLRGDPVARAAPCPADIVVNVNTDRAWAERASPPAHGRHVLGADCNHDTIPWLVHPAAVAIAREP